MVALKPLGMLGSGYCANLEGKKNPLFSEKLKNHLPDCDHIMEIPVASSHPFSVLLTTAGRLWRALGRIALLASLRKQEGLLLSLLAKAK